MLLIWIPNPWRWIQWSRCIARNLFGWYCLNRIRSAYLSWERLRLKNHVNFVFEFIDIRYALQSMVVLRLLRILWMSLGLWVYNVGLGLWKAVRLIISPGVLHRLTVWDRHRWIHLSHYGMVVNDHVAGVGSNCCKVMSFGLLLLITLVLRWLWISEVSLRLLLMRLNWLWTTNLVGLGHVRLIHHRKCFEARLDNLSNHIGCGIVVDVIAALYGLSCWH